jgi:type I site-specific restriction-modification system R (restriction) subunit
MLFDVNHDDVFEEWQLVANPADFFEQALFGDYAGSFGITQAVKDGFIAKV